MSFPRVELFDRHRRMPALVPALVVPLGGIIASEGLLFSGDTGYALWGYLLTLLWCALAPLRFDGETPVFTAFALVPLFRLVNLGMPVFFQLTVYWFPLVYGPLVPGLYLVASRLPPIEARWRLRPLQLLALLPLAVAVSALLAHLEFAIIRPQSLVPVWSLQQLAMISVVMIGFVGLVEELLFRGILQRTLEARLGTWTGLLLTSGVFGMMHSGYGIPVEIVFAGSIGLLFGLVYDWTDNLALVAFMHGVLNVFLFAVIPLRGPLLVL